MDGILYGFSIALSPENLLFVILGVLVGTVVGLLPGLGPTAAIGILLPLTYAMDPASALILLAGIYYGSMFGGRIPAILLNVPGDAASVVTAFDGYPLRKQGRAGEALGVTAIGSFLGGTVAIIGLTVMAPLISMWALGIGPPEMFLLTVFGLLMIALISSGAMVKGLFAAGLGILLATVGTDSIVGTARFTLGLPDLMEGIHIVPLAVGLFGVSELMLDAERRFRRDSVGSVGRIWPRVSEILGVRWAILRASLIGFFIGLIPGGGGTMSSIVAYGAEKKFSKHPEKFGKGAMDGLAATETADNASANASFIPLLTLGIPPNPVIALLAGALMIHGITPGPRLIEDSPDVFWGVIASMYIGSIALLVLNLPLIGVFVQILRVPTSIMAAVILATAVAGTFSVRNNIFDVFLMLGFGVVGYIFKKVGISSGPLILGFILAPIMEAELRRTLIISSGSLEIFIQRPMSLALVIILIALILFSWSPWKRRALATVATVDPEQVSDDESGGHGEQRGEGTVTSAEDQASRGGATPPENH